MVKKSNRKLFYYPAVAASLLTMIFPMAPVRGERTNSNIERINRQIQQKNNTIRDLENQAASYQDQIKALQVQAQNLQNEIALFDAQIKQLEAQIQATQLKIEEKTAEIERLEQEIKIKQEEIEKQRETLRELFRQLNEYDRESIFEILLKSRELSEFFNQTAYMNSFSDRVKTELDNFKKAKAELETKKQQQQEAKLELEKLIKDLQTQKETQASEKASKETLLQSTQGSEAQFQAMLNSVNEQSKTILGDIGNLMSSRQQEISRISSEAVRPTQGVSTSWYYSQNDSRWKNNRIGASGSSIGDYGCALTSVSMVFRYYGIDISPDVMARQPIFVRDLISWPTQWRNVTLKTNSGHKSGGLNATDWARIDQEIAAGHPVIVFINAVGRGAGHYVVIHSKDSRGYIVHDPVMWGGQSGANIYLETSRRYIESLYKSSTVIDQYILYG